MTNSSFKLCSILQGNLTIYDKDNSYKIIAGESFILTASEKENEEYKVIGNAIILESECN